MQFIEEEAWDESLEKKVNVKTCMPLEDKQELIVENNPSTVAPLPPTQVQQSTPQESNRAAMKNQGSASPSTPQGSTTPSSSSATPSKYSTNTRRPRFRNLNEIYEQEKVNSNASLNSLFALFCHVYYPIHFEDVVKEEKWIEVMNEEIRAIEMNDTWELVDLPQ